MLSVKSSNLIKSLDLDLTPQQKPKLLMILEGLQIIIKNPALFKNLLSEIEQYLLILKKRTRNNPRIYSNDKNRSDNRENVKKSLEKKIKDILKKIEIDNLNKTSVRPIGYGKKSKKRKKSKSRTNKRISKKSNKKKMRGGSQSFGEYLQQPMVICMILFSIFVFIEGVPLAPFVDNNLFNDWFRFV